MMNRRNTKKFYKFLINISLKNYLISKKLCVEFNEKDPEKKLKNPYIFGMYYFLKISEIIENNMYKNKKYREKNKRIRIIREYDKHVDKIEINEIKTSANN